MMKLKLEIIIGFKSGTQDGMQDFKESDIACKLNMFQALQVIHACQLIKMND